MRANASFARPPVLDVRLSATAVCDGETGHWPVTIAFTGDEAYRVQDVVVRVEGKLASAQALVSTDGRQKNFGITLAPRCSVYDPSAIAIDGKPTDTQISVSITFVGARAALT